MSRSCLYLAFAFVSALAIPAAARGQSAMSLSAGSQGKMSDSTHKITHSARKRAAKSAMAAPGAMSRHEDGMKKGDGMMKHDAMKKDDAMTKHDAMKNDDAMMKPDAMKKDGAMMKPENAMKKPR